MDFTHIWHVLDAANKKWYRGEYGTDEILRIYSVPDNSIVKMYGAENWRDASFTIQDWAEENSYLLCAHDKW